MVYTEYTVKNLKRNLNRMQKAQFCTPVHCTQHDRLLGTSKQQVICQHMLITAVGTNSLVLCLCLEMSLVIAIGIELTLCFYSCLFQKQNRIQGLKIKDRQHLLLNQNFLDPKDSAFGHQWLDQMILEVCSNINDSDFHIQELPSKAMPSPG